MAVNLVDPATPFLDETCGQFHPIGEHEACRDGAAGPEFEHAGTGTGKELQAGSEAYRFFYADVIREPCPTCEHPTGVGFTRNDSEPEKPTECVLCARAEIDNEIQFSHASGYPVTEQGPCANAECRAPHRLYGPNSTPLCPECTESQPERKAGGTRKAPKMTVPAPREPEREPELSLF